MTFDMVRCGWPNTIAILALAVLPFVAMALPSEKMAAASLTEQVDNTLGAEAIVLSMVAE